MRFSFIDKYGETVFIESEHDFANMIEKYMGGSAPYYIKDFLYPLKSELEDAYNRGYDAGWDDACSRDDD